MRICDATFGNIYRVEGDGLRIVATHHTPAVFAEARRTTPYFSPGPKNPVRRMMTTKTLFTSMTLLRRRLTLTANQRPLRPSNLAARAR